MTTPLLEPPSANALMQLGYSVSVVGQGLEVQALRLSRRARVEDGGVAVHEDADHPLGAAAEEGGKNWLQLQRGKRLPHSKSARTGGGGTF
jgi:hypothetical protein